MYVKLKCVTSIYKGENRRNGNILLTDLILHMKEYAFMKLGCDTLKIYVFKSQNSGS